ncbi:MAG: MFS transporter [Planctomycetota bacterium]|jgi:predicted MFS family arabinose efflux permease
MRPWIPLAVAFAAANLSPYLTPLVLGAASDSLGLSPDQAGLLATLEFLGLGLASLLVATSVHRLDRRRLTLAGLALAAAGHLLAALVDSYAVMLPVRFTVGVGEGVVLAATNATIAVAAGAARVYARCILTTILAASVGYAVCPTAIASWGHRGAHGCVAVVLLLALLFIARGPHSARTPVRERNGGSAIVGWLLGMTLLVTLSDALVWPFAERIGRSLGIEGETLGWLLGGSLAAGLVGAGAAERLGTRFGYVRPLLLGLWGTALAGWGMANAGAPATLFATTVAKNVTILFFFPYLLGVAAAVDRTGRTAAAVTGTMPLGVAAGPWLGGLVVEAAGFSALGWGGLGGALLATGILLRGRGNLGRGVDGC